MNPSSGEKNDVMKIECDEIEEELKKSKWNAQDRLQISSEHRLRSENLAFDIDVWYPCIKSYTFETFFIPLSRSEATSIISFYRTFYSLRRKRDLNVDQIAILYSLEKRIEKVLKKHFDGDCAFLRLCGRSPKDAEPFNRRKIHDDYTSLVDQLLKSEQKSRMNSERRNTIPSDDNNNKQYIKMHQIKLKAIAHVSNRILCVTSAQEVMNLLLTSERVYADMMDWIRYGEPEQIVLRKWEPELSLDYEFRAYVNRNQLNAISQYDHYGVYPHLIPLKQHIQDLIVEKWKEVHAHVGESSYVIDFGYLPSKDCVIVIELSPFMECTGPALFSWNNSLCRNILENGPLEFRLKKEDSVHPQLEELVETNWEIRWRTSAPVYTDIYEKILGLKKNSSPTRLVSYIIPLLISSIVLWNWGISNSMITSCILLLLLSVFCLFYCLIRKSPYEPLLKNAVLLKKSKKRHYIFCYGTLKQSFHWNQKFLSRAKFIAKATTADVHPLIIGASGVPYLLDNSPPNVGKRIKGEIWKVDDETLMGLDEYEGVDKGYYHRRLIDVTSMDSDGNNNHENSKGNTKTFQVYAYFKMMKDIDKKEFEFIKEYTMDMHCEQYKPIQHIQVKQKTYLGLIESNDDQH